MKKLIALSIALSLSASLAFAETELTIKGRGEAALVPLQIVTTEDQDDTKGGTYTDNYIGAGIGRTGSGAGVRMRLDVSADFEKRFGFRGQLDFHKNSMDTETDITVNSVDFLGVWAKPIEWIKVDVGRFNADPLRGKIGDDNWSNYTVKMTNNDAIFNRFKGDLGAHIGLTPIEGLYIGVLVPQFSPLASLSNGLDGAGETNDPATTNKNKNRAYRVYERIQVGAGYEIQNIGLVRLQFVGANPEATWKNSDGSNATTLDIDQNGNITLTHGKYEISAPRFEAAFAYTGMENLVIDFGLKAWLPIEDWVSDNWNPADQKYTDNKTFPHTIPGYSPSGTGSYWNGFQFALGATYTMGALGIAGRIDVLNVGSSWKYSEGGYDLTYNRAPEINIHLWPTYDLGFATLGIDLGLEFITKDKVEVEFAGVSRSVETDGGVRVGFGASLKKAFGNSYIKGGLAYRVGTEVNGKKEPGVFSIPIIFEYNF